MGQCFLHDVIFEIIDKFLTIDLKDTHRRKIVDFKIFKVKLTQKINVHIEYAILQ